MLAIMAYHGGISWIPGGFFAVDVFFVLSGFLITSLLIAERLSRGRIRLRAFWARRARRLLPALLVMIVAVILYARFIARPRDVSAAALGCTVSALFYVANWHFILSGQNYFVANGPVSPLLHTWTLGIEEQFYLVWPLHGRRRHVARRVVPDAVLGGSLWAPGVVARGCGCVGDRDGRHLSAGTT